MNLFLSVGAMKAGTTWLYGILEHHPDLYFTPEKEIHFLSDFYLKSQAIQDPQRLRNAKRKLGMDVGHIGVYKFLSRWYAMYLEKPDTFKWYERIFSLNRSKKFNCDFSNLTCHLESDHWQDLKSKTEELKVIYILRDPLKRLWSHVKFHHEFVGQQPDFGTWTQSQFKDFISKEFITSNGAYSQNITKLQEALSKDELKLFYFEDLVGRSKETLFELETFLDISHHTYEDERLNKKSNASRKIPMPDAFLEVAKPYIASELNSLLKLNIELHPTWKLEQVQ